MAPVARRSPAGSSGTRSAVPVAVAALVAFLLVLLAQFPARWAALALPREVKCELMAGTLWRGSCSALSVRGRPFGDLTWQLHPLALLGAALSADFSLAQGALEAKGSVQLRLSGHLTAHDLRVRMPLDSSLIAQLPPGTHASAQADLALLTVEHGRVAAVSGQIEVRGVPFDPGLPPEDYRLTFPPNAQGDPVGQIQDLGGPLELQGTLRLTPEPGYVLDARVAARPGSPPALAKQLQFLGPPDAQGRRTLSVSGTY